MQQQRDKKHLERGSKFPRRHRYLVLHRMHHGVLNCVEQLTLFQQFRVLLFFLEWPPLQRRMHHAHWLGRKDQDVMDN